VALEKVKKSGTFSCNGRKTKQRRAKRGEKNAQPEAGPSAEAGYLPGLTSYVTKTCGRRRGVGKAAVCRSIERQENRPNGRRTKATGRLGELQNRVGEK